MKPANLERFRSRFNETSESVRVVAFVSPTCLVCQYGAGALRVVFDLGQQDNVAGLVSWIPMMDADDRDVATTEAAHLDLAGVEHFWDGERELGDAFSKMLGLTCSAWDVYLLYAPGITWAGDAPPEPTFWMHQLQSARGAPAGLVLNPKSFLERYLGLLGRAGEVTDDLALLFHAYALSVVKADRDKTQPTLEDVASTQA